MKRHLLAAPALLALALFAFEPAAAQSPPVLNPAPTQNPCYRVLVGGLAVCQPVDANHPLPVTGPSGGGGGENQPPGATVPITAVTYSQGQSLGGLLSITSGSSGIVTFLGLRSVDGLTITVSDYVFSKNPTASTCTNGSAFVLGSADRPYLLGGAPVVLTLAASGVGSADTATYAQAQNQTLNFVQQDSPAATVLYHCLVTQGAIGSAPTANGLRLYQGNTQG